jgi:hypothetical protein
MGQNIARSMYVTDRMAQSGRRWSVAAAQPRATRIGHLRVISEAPPTS